MCFLSQVKDVRSCFRNVNIPFLGLFFRKEEAKPKASPSPSPSTHSSSSSSSDGKTKPQQTSVKAVRDNKARMEKKAQVRGIWRRKLEFEGDWAKVVRKISVTYCQFFQESKSFVANLFRGRAVTEQVSECFDSLSIPGYQNLIVWCFLKELGVFCGWEIPNFDELWRSYVDWLIDWLKNWLMNWLVDWWISTWWDRFVWLIDWLTD